MKSRKYKKNGFQQKQSRIDKEKNKVIKLEDKEYMKKHARTNVSMLEMIVELSLDSLTKSLPVFVLTTSKNSDKTILTATPFPHEPEFYMNDDEVDEDKFNMYCKLCINQHISNNYENIDFDKLDIYTLINYKVLGSEDVIRFIDIRNKESIYFRIDEIISEYYKMKNVA